MAIGGLIRAAKAGEKILDTPKPKTVLARDELDNILDEVQGPGQPIGPKTKYQHAEDELDKVIDQWAAEDKAKKAEAEPVPAIEEVNKALGLEQEPDKDVLDEILDSFGVDKADPFEQEPMKPTPFEYLKMNFDGHVGMGLTDEELDIIGEEWASKMLLLIEKGWSGTGTIQGGIKAILKKQSGEPLEAYEEAEFDVITNWMEKIDTDTMQLAVEDIDIDDLTIGASNQNAPFKIQDMLTTSASMRNFDDITQGDPDKAAALTVMTHIRGADFMTAPRRALINNYGGMSPAQFPSEKVASEMDAFDMAAINFYTRSGDGVINDVLRQKAYDPDSQVGKAIIALTNALDSLPPWSPANDGQVLYRKMNDPAMLDLYGNLEPGDEFVDRAFVSTTHTPHFKLDNVDHPSNGKVNIVIKPKENSNARGIEGISDFRGEDEVLYKAATPFKVVDKELHKNRDDQDILFIFLEEM